MSPRHGLLVGEHGFIGWPARLAQAGPWSLHVWPRLCELGVVGGSLGLTIMGLIVCRMLLMGLCCGAYFMAQAKGARALGCMAQVSLGWTLDCMAQTMGPVHWSAWP